MIRPIFYESSFSFLVAILISFGLNFIKTVYFTEEFRVKCMKIYLYFGFVGCPK